MDYELQKFSVKKKYIKVMWHEQAYNGTEFSLHWNRFEMTTSHMGSLDICE